MRAHDPVSIYGTKKQQFFNSRKPHISRKTVLPLNLEQKRPHTGDQPMRKKEGSRGRRS